MGKKRVGIAVYGLMSSTRIKKKPIQMLCGREMIAHQIDRLKTAKIPEVIILCTSNLPRDRVLIELAERENIEVFAGPEDDLLARLLQAAEEYGVDYITTSSADNPLTCAEHIDVSIKHIIENDLDYVDGEGVLPIGIYAKVVKISALNLAYQIKDETDTSFYSAYFTKTEGLFRTGKIKALPWVKNIDYRLTVDTPKDFELATRIFEKLYHSGEIFPISEALIYLQQNPEIRNINSQVQQIPNHVFPFKLKKEFEKYLSKSYCNA